MAHIDDAVGMYENGISIGQPIAVKDPHIAHHKVSHDLECTRRPAGR